MEPLEILAHLAGIGTPPDGPTALNLSVGLDQTISRLDQETFPFLSGGGCELQFVHGQYGRGKSHFLRTVETFARNHGFVTAYVECGMGNSPFKSVRDTYEMIAKHMVAPPSDQAGPPVEGVAGVIRERFRSLKRDAQIELLMKVHKSQYLSPDYRKVVYALGLKSVTGETNIGLRESLEALLNADSAFHVTLGSLHKAHPDLPKPLGKLGNRNAGQWIRSLVSLPRILGYPGLIILFDETEKGHSFGQRYSRSQQEHLANLRNFVDYMALGSFRGVGIFYAVVEDFLEVAKERLEALSQRIERVSDSLATQNGKRKSNPRAVWVSLDELTDPAPNTPVFFEHLGAKIIEVGRLAGLPEDRERLVRGRLKEKATTSSESIFVGAVREFVKFAAAQVAQEVDRHV